ncbi:MAG: hypothetical protein ACR2O6_09050, partial [Ilumatobacteraceae bacterium]
MGTNHDQNANHDNTRSGQPTPIWQRAIGLATFTAVLASAAPMATDVAETDMVPAASGTNAIAPAAPSTGSTGTPAPVRDDDTSPDETADYVGGIAAQLRTHDANDIPGDLYLLMAREGSAAKARVYDNTPYTVPGIHPEATESNHAAADTVEQITGHDIASIDFTSAPGGGPSGGVTYTIAYLNIISNGAFTGHLSVAATGALQEDGYIQPIKAIDEKTAAAHL